MLQSINIIEQKKPESLPAFFKRNESIILFLAIAS